jgi:hypothetical protein
MIAYKVYLLYERSLPYYYYRVAVGQDQNSI